MQDKVLKIVEELKLALENAKSGEDLNEVRVKYLGKKGEFTAMMKEMGKLSPEERPKFGQIINSARSEAEALLGAAQKDMDKKLQQIKFEKEKLDITMPGKKTATGSLHPLTKVYREVTEIFMNMGYTIMKGPRWNTMSITLRCSTFQKTIRQEICRIHST